MIDTKKITLIHVAKANIGLEDENYRDLLFAEAGVRSAKDLSPEGFDRVMKRFERLGFVSTARRSFKRDRTPQPKGLVTPAQQELITTNYWLLGFDSAARRTGFNRRCCRRAFPQTRVDAIKVIEGQEALLVRQVTGCVAASLFVRFPSLPVASVAAVTTLVISALTNGQPEPSFP